MRAIADDSGHPQEGRMAVPVFLTAEQVADTLHVSQNTVYELLKRGELAGTRVGRRWLIPEHVIVALAESATAAVRA
jgi:excisionase family DNA binding protein